MGSRMKLLSVSVFDSIRIPDGRGVLDEALRVRVDGTDDETSAARYGAAPEGHEVESPERTVCEAVETRAVNREHGPDGRFDVRDESFRNGYLYGAW